MTIALFRAILKKGRIVFCKARLGRAANELQRQERESRIATAEVDKAWRSVDLNGLQGACHTGFITDVEPNINEGS